jgi:hypothetical protein
MFWYRTFGKCAAEFETFVFAGVVLQVKFVFAITREIDIPAAAVEVRNDAGFSTRCNRCWMMGCRVLREKANTECAEFRNFGIAQVRPISFSRQVLSERSASPDRAKPEVKEPIDSGDSAGLLK